MELKLKNALAIFDLETTGTSISLDRIVEISIVKILPNNEEIIKTLRINPEIPIPLESSMIHGIYDKDVQDAPTFKSVAKELSVFLSGADLGGFNCLKFDIPLLVEEFSRAGVDFDTSNRKFVDAQKIFHMMEKRTLTAAYKFYCNKVLEGAHGAEADTLATTAVIKAQVERYQGQEVIDPMGNKIGVLENSIDSLHQLSASNMVDLAGRFVFNQDGVEVFNFGKHKNKPVEEILKVESGYYDWMMKGDFPMDTKRKLTQIKLRGFNSR
ncbi:3'-5' exonuclease [Reichenbachiella agarivorans]|uniref:3'-5' exonuclease n=1 Tax=Reichenbachiella agarivorans TaxID=2979464 RepID=A0ABY6CS55_9BACT|nr:3'-5' exonuclease [Reichenbachiella agarivorans]UXP31125.1 3'-5' exonuclease [Reichenbachiella agarivorans]